MSYSRVSNHASMVFDLQRNELYAKAIRSRVQPDSIVLDLGAGLGVHGLIAAASGAARVYLVEPEPVLHIAKEIARANGLQDRLVFIKERIEDAALPEKVDLLVSVFTGNLLFTEDLLPSLFLARDRYLKPDGAMVPDRAQLWLAPVHSPKLHQSQVGRWSTPAMGLDFSLARAFAANEIVWPAREEFAGSRLLASGAAIAEVDFRTETSADCRGDARCRVEESALCHGLLGWVRMRLGDDWLGTGLEEKVHWRPALLPIDPPLPIEAGEEIEMRLLRPALGDWTWSLQARAGHRTHSSFLSRAESPGELRRLAPTSHPGLSAEGEQALQVLQALRQGASNGEAARALAQAQGLIESAALQRVQALVDRYGARH